jgi:hypothetical protein
MALSDFGVQDFASTEAKHQHATTLEIEKSYHHFGISEFGILRVEKPKQKHATTLEIAKSDHQFGISEFRIPRVQKPKQQHTTTLEIVKKERWTSDLGF